MDFEHLFFDHTVPVLVGLAAALTALTVLFKRGSALIRWVYRLANALHDFIEEWYGDDDNVGVLGRLERIEHQIHPNDGGSVADSVYRIEGSVSHLEQRMTLDEQKFDGLVEKISRLHPEPTMEE